MTSLGYSNVMNYFNGSYTVISYSYGFMEICPLFSVSRHHNQPYSSERHHKSQLGSFFPFSSLPPHIHYSSLQCPARWPSLCKTDEQRVRCPLEFVWTPSSIFYADRRLKTPQTPETPECPVTGDGR